MPVDREGRDRSLFVFVTSVQPAGAVSMGCAPAPLEPNPSEAISTSASAAAGAFRRRLVVESDAYWAEYEPWNEIPPAPDACGEKHTAATAQRNSAVRGRKAVIGAWRRRRLGLLPSLTLPTPTVVTGRAFARRAP
jgi:hypothetical protein